MTCRINKVVTLSVTKRTLSVLGGKMKFAKIFEPGKIGKMRLKNRLVMPPMVRNYATREGAMTRRYLDHLTSIAKGGVGMMILEATYISQEGKGFANQLGIHKDKMIPGLRRAVKVCHKSGAKVGIQIYHAGRQTYKAITGTKQVAPSAIAEPVFIKETPRALTLKEIKALVEKFAKACWRAKKAGFDFVEIHGAHGYLITQFLSAYSNKRKDSYGGSLENRLRFLLEIIARVKKLCGNDYPVTVRLSGAENIPGGITIAETQKVSQALEKAGAQALHISAGNYSTYVQGLMLPPMAMPEAPLLPLAIAVKKVVSIPVIAVAKIHNPNLINEVLAKGEADFVAIGRPLLADPEYPNKLKEGWWEDVNQCITCNEGCITRLFAQKDVWCLANPACSREKEFAVRRVTKPRKILIVGGGPAGMSAALWSAKRGHKVWLYEKDKKLGGALNLAQVPPFRQGMKTLRDYYAGEMDCWGVKVNLGKVVDETLVRKIKPDAVIIASGSMPFCPAIPGIEKVKKVQIDELLAGKAKAKGKIIIAGGGASGAELADFLSAQKLNVTVVEAGPTIASSMPVDEGFLLTQRLAKQKVTLLPNTKIVEFGKNKVIVQTKTGKKSLPVDMVVPCFGAKPNNQLSKRIKKLVKKVIVVGDAQKVGGALDAILTGAKAGVRA